MCIEHTHIFHVKSLNIRIQRNQNNKNVQNEVPVLLEPRHWFNLNAKKKKRTPNIDTGLISPSRFANKFGFRRLCHSHRSIRAPHSVSHFRLAGSRSMRQLPKMAPSISAGSSPDHSKPRSLEFTVVTVVLSTGRASESAMITLRLKRKGSRSLGRSRKRLDGRGERPRRVLFENALTF